MTIHISRFGAFLKTSPDFCPPVAERPYRRETRTALRLFREASVAFVAGDNGAYRDLSDQIDALFNDAVFEARMDTLRENSSQDG